MIKMIPISETSTWDFIHNTIEQINLYSIEDWFDLQLMQESRRASRLSHITAYADKETFIGAINDFISWFNEQEYAITS